MSGTSGINDNANATANASSTIDFSDYQIFTDASSDVQTLHNDLTDQKNKVLGAKKIICSPDVFLGPIADSCKDALDILDTRVLASLDNFDTISHYFQEVADAYKKHDSRASFKIIGLDENGKAFITDVDPNLLVDTSTAWVWPLGKNTKCVLTSYNGSGHHGIDIATYGQQGMNVYAACGGVVESSGSNSSGYGYWVKIRHDDGTVSIYGHFSNTQPMVTKGQRVAAGQAIGKLGSTGNSTGPHVHFELRGKGGVGYLDPLKYYPQLRRQFT